MKAIESDRDQPLKNDIRKMEHQHRTVCEDILKLEERLRDLKRTKTKLEARITEARSARDSELSGYKGALGECDKRINDIMNYPEISVLEVEGSWHKMLTFAPWSASTSRASNFSRLGPSGEQCPWLRIGGKERCKS